MNIFFHIIVIISYLSLIWYWWHRASRGVWAPSTFFGFYTIIFGMPVYLFSLVDGKYSAEIFTEDPKMTAVLLAFGMYPGAIAAMMVEHASGISSHFSIKSERRRINYELTFQCLMIVSVVLLVWIFLTPRKEMLFSLVRGLALGDSGELNYMRRSEFSDGFFNQKVFNWSRFAIGPILALIVSEVTRGKLPSLLRWLLSYLVYFLFSAAFHKSTWVLGFAFIALNEFLFLPKKYAKRPDVLALLLVLLSLGAGSLLAVSYALQYRANENLTVGYHLVHGFTRMFGCVNDGLLTFTHVFPEKHEFMTINVLLGPMGSDDSGGPARVSALALGVDTTIQPGTLGDLYAGVGIWCIPLYIVLVSIVCFVANIASVQSSNYLFRRVTLPVLTLSVMWFLHNPLFPAVFSSGFFVSVCICLIFKLVSMRSNQNGRSYS